MRLPNTWQLVLPEFLKSKNKEFQILYKYSCFNLKLNALITMWLLADRNLANVLGSIFQIYYQITLPNPTNNKLEFYNLSFSQFNFSRNTDVNKTKQNKIKKIWRL